MKKAEKIEKIKSISSESEIHELLVDLLPLMSYKDVTLTHERGSNPELGKDVVASQLDIIENKKEWTAFVVKKGDVRGTSVGTQEIKAQVQECFEFAWHSISKGKDNKINKVKVVTNGKYNHGAVQKILSDSFYNNPNISLWSCEELVEYIDRFYPRYWLRGNKAYKHYIELFQEKNKEDDLTKVLGIGDAKIEKIIANAIKPKLTELHINVDGELKRRTFETHDVSKLKECAIIVGESGSGKSTFLKQLASDIIFENSIRNDFELYPIILKCKDLIDVNFDIGELIKKFLNSEGIIDAKLDIEELLSNQNFVLFLDALDEVGSIEMKENTLESVQSFRSDYPGIKIYITSRPSDSLLANCQKLKFKYLEILSVSLQQAEQFIGRYFNDETVKCKRLLKSLRDSKILDKLPKTPLTLALITAIFDENEMEIPATISDLYKTFVDLILNKLIKESTLDLLKVGIHRGVLAYIAETLHKARKINISKSELRTLLSIFAEERGQKYNVDELIDDLINNHGLLIVNERDEIEFKHLSFQEYFTAYQFYNHNISGKDLFVNNFNDIWWQNVAIFYAGMTKDSPSLLNEILEKSKPKNFHEALINMSGIGFLLQALYNTPISSRVTGIKRNLENASEAANFLQTTKDPQFDIIKTLFNTEYGLYKIISHWYEFHHSSITLKEPTKAVFDDLLIQLENTHLGPDERFKIEYAAYLLAVTLSDIDDLEMSFLKGLLAQINPKNYFVVGLIDSAFKQNFKQLPKDLKRRKEIRKLKQKLDLLDRKKIAESVNIKLTDGKPLKPIPKRHN